jgi:hypothetical protein
VSGWLDGRAIDVEIAVDRGRNWTLNGTRCAEVEGCDDLDLSFTPATNLLPIRRASLAVGGRLAVRSAWLRFPGMTLEVLDQTYERMADSRYVYRSAGGSFVAVLETDAVGFVTHYPGLWTCDRSG